MSGAIILFLLGSIAGMIAYQRISEWQFNKPKYPVCGRTIQLSSKQITEGATEILIEYADHMNFEQLVETELRNDGPEEFHVHVRKLIEEQRQDELN